MTVSILNRQAPRVQATHNATEYSMEGAMARMRFSVPDEVKKQFDSEFAGENKSRVMARMMMQAIEERQLQRIHDRGARHTQRRLRIK